MPLLASSSLPAFLITLILLIVPAHAITLTHKISDNDVRSKNCAFKFSGKKYDLCPLFKGGVRRHVDAGVVHGEGSTSRRVYELSFIDGIVEVPAESAPLCPEETWVCMTARIVEVSSNEVENTDPSWMLTAVGEGRSMTTDAEVVVPLATGKGDKSLTPPITLHLTGGVADSARWRSASIVFRCSLGGDSSDDLRFVGERGGVHSFLWVTQHACPIAQRSNTKVAFRVSQAEDGSPDASQPVEEEEKKDEDMLKPSYPRLGTVRGWTFVIFILVVFVVICASALTVSPGARNVVVERLHTLCYTVMPVISRVVIALEPLQKRLGVLSPTSLYQLGLRFRQGDRRHVQWAREDIPLEEDIMINGAGADSGYAIPEDRWNANDFGECIPLTISPKWRPAVRTYGSTPATPNFNPQAPKMASGIGRFFRI